MIKNGYIVKSILDKTPICVYELQVFDNYYVFGLYFEVSRQWYDANVIVLSEIFVGEI